MPAGITLGSADRYAAALSTGVRNTGALSDAAAPAPPPEREARENTPGGAEDDEDDEDDGAPAVDAGVPPNPSTVNGS